MPPVDAYASMPHYADHIAPIFDALEEPGEFYRQAKGLGPGPLTIVAGYPDMRRTRHRRHVLVEHGAGETWGGTDPHYAGGVSRETVDLFICPSQRVLDLNLDRYPRARGIVANPRLEWLAQERKRALHPHGHPLRVVVSFHWDNRTWKATTSALTWYSERFATYKGFELRGHAHPRIADRARKYYERAGIEFIPSFAEVVRWADVYACDNSSTIFEAWALGIPVVLLDAPWFPSGDGSMRFDRYADIGPHATRDDFCEVALSANDKRVIYDETRIAEVFGKITGSTQLAAATIQEVNLDSSSRMEPAFGGTDHSEPSY